jgi:integrase
MITTLKPKRPKRETKAPRIWLHKGANQYICKIGYKRVCRGGIWMRVRDFQRLGRDENNALRRALQFQADWLWTINFFKTSEHFRNQAPYWLTPEQVRLYKTAESADINKVYVLENSVNVGEHNGEENFQSNDEQLAEGRRRTITIAEAKKLFLDHMKARIGLAGGKGVRDYTYRHYVYDLEQSLRFIDTEKPVNSLTRTDIETLVNKWMALPDYLKKPGTKISVRTAANYCKAFKKLLDWMDSQETLGFNKPKGTDSIFRFRNFNPIKIRIYSNDELKAIMSAHPEHFRLYPLLAINCGYYQIDVATLRHDHLVTVIGDKIEPISDIFSSSGDVFIKRRRQKTLHQNDFETLCYLWPETVELLKKYGAPIDNPHGLVLLNENAMPLQRSKTNNITNRFNRYKKDAGLARECQFKQFRKTGATWMENHHGERVARLYSAHTLGGELKRYAAQSFDPLTAALKQWREELRNHSVL